MKVHCIALTPDSEYVIARAYGICTNRDVPIENIQKWIKAGHESPIEHASATFLIQGISRACLSQLTRHRLASYSAQSMRYTNQSAQLCVVPKSISGNVATMEIISAISKMARVAYRNLLALGISKEDARMVLPLATSTELIMSANYREWRHIIKLRCDKTAQQEIRELCTEILKQLYDVAPNVFGDLYKEYIND